MLLEQALVAVQHLPEGTRRSSRPSTCGSSCGPPLLQLGQLERVLALSQEAEAWPRSSATSRAWPASTPISSTTTT